MSSESSDRPAEPNQGKWRRGPILGSRWIEPGRLLVGPYPGGAVDALARAGIDLIVDLTRDDDGLPGYALPPGVRHVSRPVRDFGCPTPDEMRGTLDLLDRELARGCRVYLHCRGGIGRTGLTTACYLVRHGATPDEALARLRAAGKGPEHEAQRQFVADWRG